MERRVLIAVVLSFLVLYGYQALFVPPAQPAPNQDTAQAPALPPPAGPAASSRPAPIEAAPPVPQPDAITAETAERQIVVETATVEATLSNRGGRVLGWRLKEYRNARGEPVDLVPSGLPADQATPFMLRVEDAQITERLNNALYRVTGDANGRVDARTSEAVVVFEFEDASGLRARKELRFDPHNYLVTFSAEVSSGDRALNPAVLWGPGLGDIGATAGGGSFFTGNYIQPPQAIYHWAGDVERITGADVPEQPVHEGQFRFAGIDDHYFIATAVNPGQARVEFGTLTVPGRGRDSPSAGVSDFQLPAAAGRDPILLWAQAVRPPEIGGCRARPRDQFRHLRISGGAAARCAPVDLRFRRQLRVGHHPAYPPDQRRHLTAAPQERRIDAQDAGAAAAR